MTHLCRIILIALITTGCNSHKQTATNTPHQELKAEAKTNSGAGESATQGQLDADVKPLPFINVNGEGKTTEPLRVGYTLYRDFVSGSLQYRKGTQVLASLPLPELTRGEHVLTIPAGFAVSANPETFNCHLDATASRDGGVTIFISQLWDDSYSGNPIYDYKPTITNDYGELMDDAAAFRGDEINVSGFNIPFKKNLQLREKHQAPEIEILGVNLQLDMPVLCKNGATVAASKLRDVRVVSSLSHQQQAAIPELKAARYSVPLEIALPEENVFEIVGTLK